MRVNVDLSGFMQKEPLSKLHVTSYSVLNDNLLIISGSKNKVSF